MAPPPRASSTERPAGPSTAVIEGVVRLAEGAELPEWPDDPMSPPSRPGVPERCTPANPDDRRPVRRAGPDRLAGVLVALADFETEPPPERRTHELAIRDCRLTPSLVVARLGDRLRVTNETNYPFLPDFGTGLLQAVLHGNSREVELDRGGMRWLECGFAAACGRAVIITVHHSLHAITDEDGRFRIEGVPPEELRIGAWHPLLSEAEQTLTLRARETRQIELVVRPAPPAEPQPELPPHDGPAEDNPANVPF